MMPTISQHISAYQYSLQTNNVQQVPLSVIISHNYTSVNDICIGISPNDKTDDDSAHYH